MHLVHVITKCDYGGAQTVVRELALEQASRGHEVSVITGVVGPVSDELRAAGVHVEHEPALAHAIHLRHDWKALRHLTERVERLGPDLAHTHSSKAGFLGRRVARDLGIPVVYTAHGWPFQHGAASSQRVASFAGEWFSARSSGPVVCVSTADLRLARRAHVCPPRRLHLVHNGIGHRDDPPFERQPSSGPLHLLMPARFAAPKRQDLLIEALRHLADVRVTFAGDGPRMQEMRHLAEPYGNRVRFVGATDVTPLMATADILVLMSDYEGLAMSVIEAMRAGLPVIANRLPGLRDAVDDGRSGLLCEATPQDLAAAVDRLRDPERRAEMGASARRDWASRFTANAMTDRYEDVYEHAVAEQRTRS